MTVRLGPAGPVRTNVIRARAPIQWAGWTEYPSAGRTAGLSSRTWPVACVGHCSGSMYCPNYWLLAIHACTHAVVDLTFSGDITIDRIGDLGRGPRDFVAFGREEPRRQSVCAVRGISRSQLVLNRFARCLARHCLRWAVVGGSAGCSGRACAFISHAINTVFMNTTHHQRDFAH